MTALARALNAAALSGMLFAIALPARAEQADRDKPLVYSADHLSYDDLKQTTILTGNVELTKGTIIVRGDRAEVHQDPEGYSYAKATRDKGLAYIRQKRDGVDEYFEGYGKEIDYDGKDDVSTLVGQAVARRLQGLTTVIDEVHGSTIRYDGQTGYYTATSAGNKAQSGGRVHGMIAPATAPLPPATATPPAAAPAKPAGKATASPAGAGTGTGGQRDGGANDSNNGNADAPDTAAAVEPTVPGVSAATATADAANAAADARAAEKGAAAASGASAPAAANLTPAQTLEKTE